MVKIRRSKPRPVKFKIKKSVVSIQDRLDAAKREGAEQHQRELLWSQKIRRLHVDDVYKMFQSMSEDRYAVHMERLKELVAIDEAGYTTCICTKCAGKCPTKIVGTVPTVCYHCMFGQHKVSSRPNTTLKTEKKDGSTVTSRRRFKVRRRR